MKKNFNRNSSAFNISGLSVKIVSNGLKIVNEFLGFQDGNFEYLRRVSNEAKLLHGSITQKSWSCWNSNSRPSEHVNSLFQFRWVLIIMVMIINLYIYIYKSETG
jgi:hypothetical protein